MTDYKAMTDNQLLAAFYGCSAEAFNELVNRWRPALERYFRRLGWPPEDAEEMANDTLMKIYATKFKATGRYDPERAFAPWIFTIANRVAIDRARGEGRRPRTDPLPGDVAGEKPARGTGHRDADLAECLDTLDEQERTFVILWKEGLGELSQTEIAKLLGVSDSTVNSVKNRALTKLRDCMEEKGYR